MRKWLDSLSDDEFAAIAIAITMLGLVVIGLNSNSFIEFFGNLVAVVLIIIGCIIIFIISG